MTARLRRAAFLGLVALAAVLLVGAGERSSAATEVTEDDDEVQLREVYVAHPEFQPYPRRVVVKSGETTRLAVDLRQDGVRARP